MEIIERYIYAVTHRLPQSQRGDIAQELRGLIEDMLDERVGNRERTKEDVEDLLVELGSPVNLAAKYRGSKRYLISPELFQPYISILKIVMFAITIAMSVVFVIDTIIDPNLIIEHVLSFIVSFITVGTQAFAWVTAGFAIADYKGAIPKEFKKGPVNNWKPSDLPPVPDRKKQIKRGEALAGVIFSVIFLVLFIVSNHLIGIFIFNNNEFVGIIPFLNEEALARVLPLIYFIIGVGILKECFKLITGKWTKKLAFYTLLFNSITLGLLAFIFRDQMIWNPNFMEELVLYSELNPQDESYGIINEIWMKSRHSIVIIFLIILIVDTASTFYRAYKR